MALQVTPFEINLDLATIPVNREWNFSSVAPQPLLLLPLNRNVLVYKIEVEFDLPVVAPNTDIVIDSWAFRFRPNYLDGVFILGYQGTVINPISGPFNVAAGQPIFSIDNFNSSLDFKDGFLMGGITIWNFNQIVLSNTTTTLPANASIYVNIYWEDLC